VVSPGFTLSTWTLEETDLFYPCLAHGCAHGRQGGTRLPKERRGHWWRGSWPLGRHEATSVELAAAWGGRGHQHGVRGHLGRIRPPGWRARSHRDERGCIGRGMADGEGCIRSWRGELSFFSLDIPLISTSRTRMDLPAGGRACIAQELK
jgi:hypothetical protein